MLDERGEHELHPVGGAVVEGEYDQVAFDRYATRPERGQRGLERHDTRVRHEPCQLVCECVSR